MKLWENPHSKGTLEREFYKEIGHTGIGREYNLDSNSCRSKKVKKKLSQGTTRKEAKWKKR